MAKIYWAIHGYPPQQNAGAEWMAKEINDYLESKGHQIIIYLPGDNLKFDIEQKAPDIIITHLDMSAEATNLARELSIPCINVIHHTFQINHLRGQYNSTYLLYNSQWVADACRYDCLSSVLHPPVNPDRFFHTTPDQDYITLVNCNKDKGALIFQDIARAMPHRNFLAVKGHHGPQIKLYAPNIKQIEPVDRIETILQNTSILLIPSIYESYGRIGIEAMCCGIPVIATNTPGLKEALDDTDCHFIENRNRIPAWIKSIEIMFRHDNLQRASERRVRMQMKWEQSLKELESLNNLIFQLCGQK